MTACYIFDLDGTLFDCEHRRHHLLKTPKDWKAFHAGVAEDPPLQHIVDLAFALGRIAQLVFVSGRIAESRAASQHALEALGLNGPLYMRAENDFRDDDIVKSEILDQILEEGFAPIMAFDDRDRVVAMWRARGIPCAQVAPGDF